MIRHVSHVVNVNISLDTCHHYSHHIKILHRYDTNKRMRLYTYVYYM